MFEEYAPVFIYFVFMFSLFVGVLVWQKYRKSIMRKFHLQEYGPKNHNPSHHAPHP